MPCVEMELQTLSRGFHFQRQQYAIFFVPTSFAIFGTSEKYTAPVGEDFFCNS